MLGQQMLKSGYLRGAFGRCALTFNRLNVTRNGIFPPFRFGQEAQSVLSHAEVVVNNREIACVVIVGRHVELFQDGNCLAVRRDCTLGLSLSGTKRSVLCVSARSLAYCKCLGLKSTRRCWMLSVSS